MRVRSKPPSLVSMWMLDVFCCALGCVTLLWLLNTREARLRAEAAARTGETLKLTRADLEEANRRAAALFAEVETLNARVAALTAQRDDNAQQLAAARRDIDATRRKLADADAAVDSLVESMAALGARAEEAEWRLAGREGDLDALAKKLLDAQRQSMTLQTLLREKEKLREDAARRSVALNEQLDALDARYRALLKKLDETARAGEDARGQLAEVPKLRQRVRDLERMLADRQEKLDRASTTIIDLQGEKAKLADKFDRLQLQQESRFAGIALTGKRVVFLVDMSGSMNQKDLKTPDPNKWPTVRETVAKVMRSLPELEQFQVILFSVKPQHLLGREGQWIDYRGEETVQQVLRAMAAVQPGGDTNMYQGLEAAFAYRARGLDTIYFFSDGLPTIGPGLTEAQQRTTLSESERSNLLARHVRATLQDTWNRELASLPRVRINSVGFFYESPEVGAFLWALSRENDGSFVGMSKP
ncbi:MAG TPA: VWA domain-containing protein [Gemmataceae bacterium]